MSVEGIANVTTLPVARGPVPTSPLQGTLALAFDGEGVPLVSPAAQDRLAVERLVPRLCAVVVEVLGGDRGVHQLLRWTTDEVYEDMVQRMNALNATAARDQRVRRLRAQVRSVRISWPTGRAAEVSVHVRHGRRSRAMAARVELVDGRWVCSALQVG